MIAIIEQISPANALEKNTMGFSGQTTQAAMFFAFIQHNAPCRWSPNVFDHSAGAGISTLP